MKEGVEGDHLKTFLENVFMAFLGSGSNEEVKLITAYIMTGVGISKIKGERETGYEDFSRGIG